jgi:hypothetical protein
MALKRIPAAFYALSSGREPVREWLRGLAAEDRKVIGEDIKDVEFSWPIGLPLCRSARGRAVGSAERPGAGTHGAGSVLHHRRSHGPAARVRQEDTEAAS